MDTDEYLATINNGNLDNEKNSVNYLFIFIIVVIIVLIVIFPLTKAELLPLLEGKDLAVFRRSLELSSGIPHDFSGSFELLFTWCQETMAQFN